MTWQCDPKKNTEGYETTSDMVIPLQAINFRNRISVHASLLQSPMMTSQFIYQLPPGIGESEGGTSSRGSRRTIRVTLPNHVATVDFNVLVRKRSTRWNRNRLGPDWVGAGVIEGTNGRGCTPVRKSVDTASNIDVFYFPEKKIRFVRLKRNLKRR